MSRTLRPFQKQALDALERACAHLLCVAPTGSGKSLIYERMAARPGARTLLVTPLIALARQQLERLRGAGIPVIASTGRLSDSDELPRSGVWIVSPESLLSDSRQRRLERWSPTFLAVDECHCLWEWGGSFRPAFERLPELIRDLEIPRSLWLTATMPRPARLALRAALGALGLELGEMGAFSLPANLSLEAPRVPWPMRASALIEQVEAWRRIGSGIVFAQSRGGCERIARLLEAAGISCVVYHAGLSSEERRNAELSVQARETEVVVATSAFGMGMDHAHLRWVLLWQAPPSLLALAQAVGRAGRDPGTAAYASVFWDAEDFQLIDWMIQGSQRRRADLRAVARLLPVGMGSGSEKSRLKAGLEDYFNSETQEGDSAGVYAV